VAVIFPNLPAIADALRWVQRWLPAIYAVWALSFLLTLAAVMPPNGNADELEHFTYATRIGSGHFFGTSSSGVAGSIVDPAVPAALEPFAASPFHPEIKTDLKELKTANSLRWSNKEIFVPWAATYPPFLYAPQAMAVRIGRLLDMSVLESFYMARVANVFASVIIIAMALAYARRTRFALAAIAMLPMTTSLNASISHDSLVIALVMLSVGLIDRMIHDQRSGTRSETAVVAIALALVATSKPSYLPLVGLIFLTGPCRSLRVWSGITLGLLATAAWWSFASKVSASIRPGIDAGAQFHLLLSEPMRIVAVAHATLSDRLPGYLRQFIGGIGWLDVRLPVPFEAFISAGTIIIVFSTFAGPARRWRTALFCIATAALGVFGLLYLVASSPGAATVDTVQGRYFLPIAAAAPLALPGFLSLQGSLQLAAALAVILEAIVIPGTVVWAIIARHYMSA
jgi:uncharacterized membrane protein